MQSPTGQSPHHQNRPEEEEEEDDGDEVPPIRSEMVWIVSVGTRPELDFVQVSPIQQVGYYFLGGDKKKTHFFLSQSGLYVSLIIFLGLKKKAGKIKLQLKLNYCICFFFLFF